MHTASRQGTPGLTSVLKDGEEAVWCGIQKVIYPDFNLNKTEPNSSYLTETELSTRSFISQAIATFLTQSRSDLILILLQKANLQIVKERLPEKKWVSHSILRKTLIR